MKTVLITGANRGIGKQVARELAAKGFRVFCGTRDDSRDGQPVEDIDGDARWLAADVTNSESIHEAAGRFAKQENQLDVLVNNAGVYPDNEVTITDVTRDQLNDTFQTNTFGPVEVIQAFLPSLRRSGTPRIVNISSGYGQLDGLSAGSPSYCLSKLALNGVTLIFAGALRDDGIAVNSACPGWVRTDMGGSDATRSVEEGASGIVWLATHAPHSLTGKFFRDGEEISW